MELVFLRQLRLLGILTVKTQKDKTKPSIQNKPNPDVLWQLRGIKEREGKKKIKERKKSVF